MYVGSAGIMSYNLGHTFIIEQHETYYSGRTRYRWIQNLNQTTEQVFKTCHLSQNIHYCSNTRIFSN